MLNIIDPKITEDELVHKLEFSKKELSSIETECRRFSFRTKICYILLFLNTCILILKMSLLFSNDFNTENILIHQYVVLGIICFIFTIIVCLSLSYTKRLRELSVILKSDKNFTINTTENIEIHGWRLKSLTDAYYLYKSYEVSKDNNKNDAYIEQDENKIYIITGDSVRHMTDIKLPFGYADTVLTENGFDYTVIDKLVDDAEKETARLLDEFGEWAFKNGISLTNSSPVD